MFGLSKPIPKDKGAKLAQAQNQAPDTIPGMFKPGEFVLPPDTVHAMGGKQALQGVVDATRTPVESSFGLRAPRAMGQEPATEVGLGLKRPTKSAVEPRLGLKPEVFFANGGAPEDQIQRPGMGLKPSAAPSPSNTFPGNRLQGDSGFSGAPVAAPAAPTPDPSAELRRIANMNSRGESYGSNAPNTGSFGLQPPKPAQTSALVASPAPATGGFSYADNMRSIGDDIKRTWGEGNYGEAIGKTVAGTVGGLTTPVIDGLVNGASGVAGFARGLFGVSGTNAETPASTSAPAPAKPAGTSTGASPASGPAAVTKPGITNNVGSSPATTGSTSASQAGELRPSIFNHGPGQYSDQASGMGFPAGFTGKPNAQNDAAAGTLVQSGGFGLRRPAETAASEAQGLGLYGGRGAETVSQPSWSGSIGQTSGNGNMWSRTPEQQRRDAEVQASSIHRQTAANGVAALRALDGRDLEGMRGANALEQENIRQAGGLHRTAMIEAGANQRAALADSGANARAAGQVGLGLRRLSLDQQRAASDERLRAPQIRAAERLGQLQESYINAKTPEEQAAIAAQIRAYSGKNEDEWQAIALQGGTDAAGNKTEGMLGAVNKRNGEMRRMGVQQPSAGVVITNDAAGRAAFAQLPPGSTYTGPDGKQYKKD